MPLFAVFQLRIIGLNIRMAIVFGSERFAVDRSVQGNGFAQYMEHITTGEEVPKNKPAPDVYLRALDKMDLQPGECMAIEDTEHGLLAAVSAQIPCIAIPNPFTQQHNMSKADLRLTGLQQVVDCFT